MAFTLSKKFLALAALSLMAITTSLPAHAWLIKNDSSNVFHIEGNKGTAGTHFDIRLEPGQTAACDAAEHACGGGGWMQLCFYSIPDGKLSTHGWKVDIKGGMGAIVSDYDVRVILSESDINRPPTNPIATYRLEPERKTYCGLHY